LPSIIENIDINFSQVKVSAHWARSWRSGWNMRSMHARAVRSYSQVG
jgi:hypothetical protein